MRGVSPEDAAIDLVIEDGSRVGLFGLLPHERGQTFAGRVALPWVSFGSDETGRCTRGGSSCLSAAHPRAYGNFRAGWFFAEYVRKDHAISRRRGGAQSSLRCPPIICH